MNRRGFFASLFGVIAARFAPKPPEIPSKVWGHPRWHIEALFAEQEGKTKIGDSLWVQRPGAFPPIQPLKFHKDAFTMVWPNPYQIEHPEEWYALFGPNSLHARRQREAANELDRMVFGAME